MRVRRAAIALAGLALAAPTQAFGAEFDPSEEFKLKPWISLHVGPLDMSINKAVVYLFIASALTCLFGVAFMRFRLKQRPGRRETVGELVYEVAQEQVAKQGLPTKAMGLWFPYVASLMLFIFMINLLGFLPLPLTGQTWHHIPVWGIYAATSSISVTLALATVTWVFTHIEGIRYNGPIKYFRSWIPEVPKVLLPLIVPIEILSQFMRLISLSVRLYANMLAGHLLILMMIGLIFVIHTTPWREVAGLGMVFGVAFYAFEVVLIAGIQAFIFAALSAIYIGSAIEPEH